MRFTAIFEPQAEGGYHAMCPTLPGCHSEGDTLDETVANIREAIAIYVESMIAHGETPPVDRFGESRWTGRAPTMGPSNNRRSIA